MATGDITRMGDFVFRENQSEVQEKFLYSPLSGPADGTHYLILDGEWVVFDPAVLGIVGNVDGGFANSTYLVSQNLDGGGA